MTENDGYEIAFKNGKEYMRKCVIDKLREMKDHAMGLERFVLGEVISIVQKLEVRP